MRISVTFKNKEGEKWLREYIDEKIKKLKKYIDNPSEVRVVLSVEKFRNVAEINLMANGLIINAKEEAKDMHIAIDDAIDKIERQLKKRKEKIITQKTVSIRESRIETAPIGEYIEDTQESRVVETKRVVLKPMTIDEAILEMESSRNKFVVFRDAFTENVSVLYLRDDGEYALIEEASS